MSDVGQLDALSDLFHDALQRCRPGSVALLGVAGGNGLDRIDPEVTTRIVGLDVNVAYLNAVKNRYGHLPGLELHQVDLSSDSLALPPVDLVHAALIFEHAGVEQCLEYALALLAPGGHLSVVLQVGLKGAPSTGTVRAWIEREPLDFTFVDPVEFAARLKDRGLSLVHERRLPAPTAEFWAAMFVGVVSSAGAG